MRAVAGSSVVYLLAGLKYDHNVWAEQWPRVMNNTIEACKRANAKLIFFDNVYMYGRVAGEMTEDLPFDPCSRKGEVRAQVAMTLIRCVEFRRADRDDRASVRTFTDRGAKTGMANVLVFEPMSKKQTPMCLVNDSLPHSYTYTPDAAEALMTLAVSDAAWNQTWHLPTAPNPPTGKELIEQAARAMGVPAKYRVLSKPMVRIVGWFKPLVGELHEMLYQNDSPYLFDSSKYTRAFGVRGDGVCGRDSFYVLQSYTKLGRSTWPAAAEPVAVPVRIPKEAGVGVPEAEVRLNGAGVPSIKISFYFRLILLATKRKAQVTYPGENEPKSGNGPGMNDAADCERRGTPKQAKTRIRKTERCNSLRPLKLALQSLWGNKMRTILTLLGVVMGVASVIMVITMVNGANMYVANKLSSHGADVFTISRAAERDHGAARSISSIRSGRSSESRTTRRCGTVAPNAAKWARC